MLLKMGILCTSDLTCKFLKGLKEYKGYQKWWLFLCYFIEIVCHGNTEYTEIEESDNTHYCEIQAILMRTL